MRVLDLFPIGGLFDELYSPEPSALNEMELEYSGRSSLRRASSLFWARHFAEASVENLIKMLAQKFSSNPTDNPVWRAILAAPETFVRCVAAAPYKLIDVSAGPKAMFSALETLTVLCELYSLLRYAPHKLTIQEGFITPDFSASRLLECACSETDNPYLSFILAECVSVFNDAKPDLVWMLGRPRLSTVTSAWELRKLCPNTHISIAAHSSEYYSLNKITKWLSRNEALFSLVDSVVLDDTKSTQDLLYAALSRRDSLSTVPNILYKESDGRVVQTSYSRLVAVSKPEILRRPVCTSAGTAAVQPHEIANVRLWPDSICFWNKCTFCGINKKYQIARDSGFKDIDAKIDEICAMIDSGINYFWLTDEAIPADRLVSIANGILARQKAVVWQARSRIDPRLDGTAFELLARAGLRELRLGLESACPRVLSLMEKFDASVTFQLVEKIVADAHRHGVSVHFPMIVGFPTETDLERKETYAFLRLLRQKFPSFSFNINLLMLDVSSRLYKKFEDYDITKIFLPCAARDFLGNFAEFETLDCSLRDLVRIDVERINFMRDHLYPWMPKTAKTPAHIFYRLAETSRATLVWKHLTENGDAASVYSDLSNVSGSRWKLDDATVIFDVKHTSWRSERTVGIYNWRTHHVLYGDEITGRFFEALGAGCTIADAIGIVAAAGFAQPDHAWKEVITTAIRTETIKEA